MEREERRLDRERQEEAEEEQLLDATGDGHAAQGDEVEGAGAVVGRHDVQPDDRGQHDEAAEKAVEQELHRRVRALRAAVAADDEVHRDEDDFEEDVEQEHVERGEDADHPGLQGEDQREVAADRSPAVRRDLVDLVPGGDHHDRHQQRRERDQHQRDAVDADLVVDAERLDPVVLLEELVAGLVLLEVDDHGDREAELDEREEQRGLLGQQRIGLRQQRHDQRAGERDDQQDRQKRHAALTRSARAGGRRR